MKSLSTLPPLVALPGENTRRASSLNIAEHFEKNHQHVLRDIRSLLADLPKEFGLSNFGQSNYLNAQGKSQPVYYLTRDAFCLLAMGFSGIKALAWKLLYIKAFNEMEAKLQGRNLLDTPDGAALVRRGLHLARRLTPGRRRLIKRAAFYAGLKSTNGLGLNHAEIGRLLRCGADKARLLLQEHAWIGPAAGAGSPPANPGGGHE